MTKNVQQHLGELSVQRLRGVPPFHTSSLDEYVSREVEGYTGPFLAGLPFLVVALTDEAHCPICSVVAVKRDGKLPLFGSSDGVRHVLCGTLHSRDALIPALEGLRSFVESGKPLRNDIRLKFAALGIDVQRRQRVKLNGIIVSVSLEVSGADEVTCQLLVEAEEVMGNCPKYITARSLQWVPSSDAASKASAGKTMATRPDATLSAEAKALLLRSSTSFLATLHTSDTNVLENDVGVNHRGGLQGFVRCCRSDDDSGRCFGFSSEATTASDILVIPDYSGNRFYQSLGNIETNKMVGFTVVDFESRSLLFVRGQAKNLYNKDAEYVMPGTTLVTGIKVEASFVLQGVLPFAQHGVDVPSPYNPPLRPLRHELTAQRHMQILPDGPSKEAVLVESRPMSATILRLTFAMPPAGSCTLEPGSYIVLDCSAVCPPKQYRHMDERRPQQVNDDYVRTWTVVSSTISSGADGQRRFELMIRRKTGGLVTTALFNLTCGGLLPKGGVRFPVKGFGNSVLPAVKSLVALPPRKLLVVLGGIGVTLFLSIAPYLQSDAWSKEDATIIFSRRADDAALDDAINHAVDASAAWKLVAVDSSIRRLARDDIAAVVDIAERLCVVCGPPMFSRDVRVWLADCGATRVVEEKFDF